MTTETRRHKHALTSKALITLGIARLVLDILACILTPGIFQGWRLLLIGGRIALDVGLALAPLLRGPIVRWTMIAIYSGGAFLRSAVALNVLAFGSEWTSAVWAGWVMAANLAICVLCVILLSTSSAKQHFRKAKQDER
jgi:hypothetical protein